MQLPLETTPVLRIRKAIRDPRLVLQHAKKPWYRLSDGVLYGLLFVAAVVRNGGVRTVIVAPDPFDNIGYGYRYTLWRVLLSCGARYRHAVERGADLAIAWQDETVIALSPELLAAMQDASGGTPVLNARCTDIRKSTVGRVHHEVFGYSLEVEPETWTSTLVRKSETNYRKDGVVMQGPVARQPGYVYQRLVDNEADDKTVEYRVPVIGRSIPYVNELWRPLTARFGMLGEAGAFRGRMHTDAGTIFSAREIELIHEFTHRMGCDYTELDILRSKSDGRIYIVDCNHTPGLVSHPILRYRCVHRQSKAFRENFF